MQKGARLESRKSGEYFFKEGQRADFFGYLVSGAYKLTMLYADGDEIIMHFAARGEDLAIMATMIADCNVPFDCISICCPAFLLAVLLARPFRV